ncbi:MAG TPA: exosortase-associated EpsI family protein, partial [Verrucomicrobiota bacterium]|nr:exosortase-associated EpsI family protein [Verrucomicrobiota bacterium]
AHLKTNQKLGNPGVKTEPLADSQNLRVLLPEAVPGYTSEYIETDKFVMDQLPPDTSFGQRRYVSEDGKFMALANVVLMGSDRTSIHKPQFCLTGQGWEIDSAASSEELIRVERPQPYDLPVTRLVATRQIKDNDRVVTARGIYVYWFVADDVFLADPSGLKRGLLTARELLRTGMLQRWSYVAFFSICAPGQEAATFERMKEIISKAVPEFQLSPKPAQHAAARSGAAAEK